MTPGTSRHPAGKADFTRAGARCPRRRVVRRRDRRPNRALDRRMAAGSARCPRQHVRAATRSVSWSSTCRQCAARLGPTRGLGRTAPDRGPAARERGRSRRGPGSRPHRSHRGWSLRATGGSRSETAGTVRPSRPDRAFGDDATLSSALVWDRRGLDDEPAIGDVYVQGGMEESTPRAMADECVDRLVELATQADHVRPRAERDPVEVDGSGRERGSHRCSLQTGRPSRRGSSAKR